MLGWDAGGSAACTPMSSRTVPCQHQEHMLVAACTRAMATEVRLERGSTCRERRREAEAAVSVTMGSVTSWSASTICKACRSPSCSVSFSCLQAHSAQCCSTSSSSLLHCADLVVSQTAVARSMLYDAAWQEQAPHSSCPGNVQEMS